MSKSTSEVEFRVTTKDDTVLYEGFERVMAVKSYGRIDAQKQYERKDNDEWKVKFYKPENSIYVKAKIFR